MHHDPSSSQPGTGDPHDGGFEASDAEARALASGVRLRILRLALDQPLTNRELADALGLNPATVLHHVRTLVDTGFLEALEPRRGRRGAREIPYRATGRSWYARTPVTTKGMLDAFVAEIAEVPADRADVTMTRLGLRLPPEQLEEFRTRLAELVDEFHDRARDPAAEPWSLFLALHPDRSALPGTAREDRAGPEGADAQGW
ncbi:ArsR family transcriptional regulator [Serinicoccus chungangensis]|uniref:ArsR family transcriptional regulator n=1 Tax=Serinicoccus chungangensis TaxID=767452 RepID=A0A0W8I8J1_9MICO|nr:winged helix-turn-helix domain-containing protein [Serinicoccus chungangensis]KUG55602.1 ArsR family transcriptional regulator [Serinicoccus chungangensis]